MAQARDFPKHQRLNSRLYSATLILEAAARSGSLITARLAARPRARPSYRLLKQGAALVESAEDVRNAILGITPPTFDEPFVDCLDARDANVPPALLCAVQKAQSPTPIRIDEIVRAVGSRHRRLLVAPAERKLAGEGQTDVGGTASRAV